MFDVSYDKNFADKITSACINKYNSLGKNGKPVKDQEWTLLAGVVQATIINKDCSDIKLQVVALGTGSKCIGKNQLPSEGDVLHDSHAEVIARRAFVLYIIKQIELCYSGEENSIFHENNDSKYFTLKSDISFHFYTSHTPCGDASIFPKIDTNLEVTENNLEELLEKKEIVTKSNEIENKKENISFVSNEEVDFESLYKKSENSSPPPLKKMKPNSTISKEIPSQIEIKEASLYTDIHRTGGKSVPGETKDSFAPGIEYHTVGTLRTKPGRGDPTLSHSCSDKIFRWSVLGCQGALLMLLLDKPLYIDTITIGKCPYNRNAMERALFTRFQEKLKSFEIPHPFSFKTPILLFSKIEFPFSQSILIKNCQDLNKLMPCSGSIIWSYTNIHKQKHEVAIEGRRLGCTKKNFGTEKSRVSVCRKSIMKLVCELLYKINNEHNLLKNMTYEDIKVSSKLYFELWNNLRKRVLLNWTKKPAILKKFYYN